MKTTSTFCLEGLQDHSHGILFVLLELKKSVFNLHSRLRRSPAQLRPPDKHYRPAREDVLVSPQVRRGGRMLSGRSRDRRLGSRQGSRLVLKNRREPSAQSEVLGVPFPEPEECPHSLMGWFWSGDDPLVSSNLMLKLKTKELNPASSRAENLSHSLRALREPFPEEKLLSGPSKPPLICTQELIRTDPWVLGLSLEGVQSPGRSKFLQNAGGNATLLLGTFGSSGGQFSRPVWVFTLTVSHRRPKDTSVFRELSQSETSQRGREVLYGLRQTLR